MDALIAAVVGGIAGAVVGALAGATMTGLTSRLQLKAQARHRAERVIEGLLRGLLSRLEVERRGGFPTIATDRGPFDIFHRERLVTEIVRNMPDLPLVLAGDIENSLRQILGEEAVLYTSDRAFLPDDEVDIAAEHRAKSLTLIPRYKAGTVKPGLVPEIGKLQGNDRDAAVDDAVRVINDLLRRISK